jgi:hypothetical protein
MSSAMRNGLIVAAVHVAIVTSVGAKLLVDRAARPRVWARAAPVDPNLPIRGRYVSLRVEGMIDPDHAFTAASTPVALLSRDGKLVLVRSDNPTGLTAHTVLRQGEAVAVLDQPVAYFIPEGIPDPSRRPAGEELWVELTLPAHGAPRPIRLGIRTAGVLRPLAID